MATINQIVHKIQQDPTKDVEYVLTIQFQGGPILVAIADRSFAGKELADPAFADADTKYQRFDPDPYYRSPDRCTCAGTVIFRVPFPQTNFQKRVLVGVVLANLLKATSGTYSYSLVSPNDAAINVVDVNGNPVAEDAKPVPTDTQVNIVLLIGAG